MRSNLLFQIWDYRWFCIHIFCFPFSKPKIYWRKKQLLQDLIPPPSICIHMCTLYTYTITYMLRFSPSGFLGPSRCLAPTLGLTTEYPICAVWVCVCVYAHIHPHTLPPTVTLKTKKTQTTPLSLLLSKINPQAKRRVKTSWTPPPVFPNAEWTNCTYMSAYAHPVARVYANAYADVTTPV